MRRNCVYGQNGGYGWWRFAIRKLIVTKWEARLWSKVGVGLGRYFWDLNVLVYINDNRFKCVSNFWFFSGRFSSICCLTFQEKCLKYKFTCLRGVKKISKKIPKKLWEHSMHVRFKFVCVKKIWDFFFFVRKL
jgi:hypothetical protein